MKGGKKKIYIYIYIYIIYIYIYIYIYKRQGLMGYRTLGH